MFYKIFKTPFHRTLSMTASPYTVLHRKIPSTSLNFFPTQFSYLFNFNFFRGCGKETLSQSEKAIE